MSDSSLTPSPVPAAPLLHSVPEACRVLGGMGRTWLYDQIKAGRIRTVKLGARTLIPESELRNFIASKMGVAA